VSLLPFVLILFEETYFLLNNILGNGVPQCSPLITPLCKLYASLDFVFCVYVNSAGRYCGLFSYVRPVKNCAMHREKFHDSAQH